MSAKRACIVVLLLACAGTAGPAWADPAPTVPDQRYPLSNVFGAVQHGRKGMCYLDHATCPYPWVAAGNFTGTCPSMTADFVSCTGTWNDLWFNFLVPGFGADISFQPVPVLPAVALDHAGDNDLIHLVRMQGNVSMSCGGDTCVTNFSGQTLYTDKWDCYIHDGDHSVDC